MLDRLGNVRNHLCFTFIVFRERFVNVPLPPSFSHIFLMRLPIKITTLSQLFRHCTRSHIWLSLHWKRIVELFGRVHCNCCRDSIIPCLDVLNSLSFFEYSLPLFPSKFLALVSTVLLAERKNVESGVKDVLSSGGQGN